MPLNSLRQQLKALRQRIPQEPLKIKTYQAQRWIRLDQQQITLGELKQLISGSLKLCYLYQPIEKTIEQSQKFLLDASTTPIKIKLILSILSQGLFYRHMVKFKLNSNVVANLVNNCSTQQNKKVIFAALISYSSKKLTFPEISSALLIFNLEQALLGRKLEGLPAECSFLQKTLGKIQRAIASHQLKKFIHQVKLDNESACVQAYEFIYLVALSYKKSSFHPLLHFYKNRKQNIINEKNIEAKIDIEPTNEKIRCKTMHYAKISGLNFYQPAHGSKILFKDIKNSLNPKKRSKSLLIQAQRKKNPRPQSALFQKSIQVFNQFVSQSNKSLHNKQNNMVIKKNNGHIFQPKLKKKTNLKIKHIVLNK